MDQMKIGNFLKELRKEKGITQAQLAETLNVSARTVSRWETGSNMPDISILVDIADYYDISIPEIINGERKSEMMNEEERKIAKTMSDYATTEKEKIFKEMKLGIPDMAKSRRPSMGNWVRLKTISRQAKWSRSGKTGA